MKTFIFTLIAMTSFSLLAKTPIYECNQSVFYRTQIKFIEFFPERDQNSINLLETRLDQQNLQVNIYQSEKIEIVTKYEVPSCKIRSIDINVQN